MEESEYAYIVLDSKTDDGSLLPTPPPSPTKNLEPPHDNDLPVSIKEAQRRLPFFINFDQAMAELEKIKVKTEHGGANNCLLYAFLVATDEAYFKLQKDK